MKRETLKSGETRWRHRVTVGGVKKNLTGRTKAEVEDAVREMKERERRRKLGLPEPTGDVTYDDLAQKMLDRYMKRQRSKEWLEGRLKSSRGHFGNWLVREIRTEDVEDWIVARSREVSPTTARHDLKAMRQVLNYGIDRDYLTKNPARGVPLPEIVEDAARPFESWAEVRKVAEAMAGHYAHGHALVMFVAATGLRIQEWQVLRWNDLDLKTGIANLRRTNQLEGEQTRGKSRGSLVPVQLPRIAVDALQSLPRPLDRNALVFPSPRGGVWTHKHLREVWAKALADAGIEYRPPYHLRHTFATLALTAGVPLEWISKQLRHSDMEITRRHYARWLPAAEARWVAMLDSFAAQETDQKETNVPREAAN